MWTQNALIIYRVVSSYYDESKSVVLLILFLMISLELLRSSKKWVVSQYLMEYNTISQFFENLLSLSIFSSAHIMLMDLYDFSRWFSLKCTLFCSENGLLIIEGYFPQISLIVKRNTRAFGNEYFAPLYLAFVDRTCQWVTDVPASF